MMITRYYYIFLLSPTCVILFIQVSIGNFEVNIGTLQVNGPLNQLVYIVPAFAGLVIIFIVVFIVIFSIFYRKYKQKDQQNDRLLFELERLETSVAHECKLGMYCMYVQCILN